MQQDLPRCEDRFVFSFTFVLFLFFTFAFLFLPFPCHYIIILYILCLFAFAFTLKMHATRRAGMRRSDVRARKSSRVSAAAHLLATATVLHMATTPSIMSQPEEPALYTAYTGGWLVNLITRFNLVVGIFYSNLVVLTKH